MTSVVADFVIPLDQPVAAAGYSPHARTPYRRVWNAGGTVHSRRFFGTAPVVGVAPLETLGSSMPVADFALPVEFGEEQQGPPIPIEFGEEQQGPPIPIEWAAGGRGHVAAPGEAVLGARREAGAMHEFLAWDHRDMLVPAEAMPGVGISLDAAICTEFAAGRRSDCNICFDILRIVRADPVIRAENTARLVSDLRPVGESGLLLLLGRNLPSEAGTCAHTDAGTIIAARAGVFSHASIETGHLGAAVTAAGRPAALENLAGLSPDNGSVVEICAAMMAAALLASEDLPAVCGDARGPTGTAGSSRADAAVWFELTPAALRGTSAPIESLFDLAVQTGTRMELLPALRSGWPAQFEAVSFARGAGLAIEHLGSIVENRLPVEWTARFLADWQLVGEWAAPIGNNPLVSVIGWLIGAQGPLIELIANEAGAVEWQALAPPPLFQLGEGRRLATPGRVRLLKGLSGMRLPTAFEPINSGETDNFAFDFTGDIGAAAMVSTNWTCTLAPYQTLTDPAPQSRILSTSLQTVMQIRDPLTGVLMTRAGYFSVASIGGMPAEASGSTYILTAFIRLSDGRTLALSSTVQCSAP